MYLIQSNFDGGKNFSSEVHSYLHYGMRNLSYNGNLSKYISGKFRSILRYVYIE